MGATAQRYAIEEHLAAGNHRFVTSTYVYMEFSVRCCRLCAHL